MAARRKKTTTRRKKTINVPLVSTSAGLAIFTALDGSKALTEALGGQIGTALNTVAGCMNSPQGKAGLTAAVGGAVITKLLLKSLPRNVGKLGPVVFTTG